MAPSRRKKWTEAEERTLIDKYSEMACDGSLAKMRTREKKYKPIALYVNSIHHSRDSTTYPWLWTWKDVSTKVPFLIQTQASQQVMDEAEKEYKKMAERITETREAMKASYTDFMAEAQASLSRVCKTTIPELSQNIEKAFDAMRSRYGISSTSV